MAQGLSQNDINDLLKEGYKMSEINEAIREVEQEDLTRSYGATQQRADPRTYSQHTSFAPEMQDNLIKWQLELDNILERAEHILRGDMLVNEGGHLIWKKQENPQFQILNDYGVQEVMRVLSMYLNRNTILADYDDDEVREKVLDFGREINDLFYMKYQEMGLDVNFEQAFQRLFESEATVKRELDGTYVVYTNNNNLILSVPQVKIIKMYQEKYSLEKRKNYPMLLREMVDMVHSSYSRAKDGGERRSLREARQVTQTEPLNPMGGVTINTMGAKARSPINPMRYVLGKYK